MNQDINLLVVDDDIEIRSLLRDYLRRNGYGCKAAANGVEMQRMLDEHQFDLVILDLMMPGENGLQLCSSLRTRSSIPVIMLTARGEDTDRIIGLEMGADDYVAKPFNPRELEARIKAVLRRFRQTDSASHVSVEQGDIVFGDWRLDRRGRNLVDLEGVISPLSSTEYDLLTVFLKHAGRVLSRDQLLDFTKGREAMPFDRSVDMQVSRLRKRLGVSASHREYIRTMRGQGYLFVPEVSSD